MVSQQFTCCICLPKDPSVKKLSTKDQSVKKLSTKARAPTQGPERQEIISKDQSAYRRTRTSRSYQQRTRASRSYQQRPGRLPKDQSVKKLSAKARAPTEGPECQEIISKGHRCQTGTKQQNDRHDGNHTRIGCSYTMAVPMNISSHREVGNLTDEIDKRQEEGRTRRLIRENRNPM